MDSILTSIKKQLGITEEYEHFDADLIMHINNVLADLMQIGIVECKAFVITNKDSKWSDFIDTDLWYFPMIPTYVYAKVKLRFDPPTSSSHTEALKATISETEFRLKIAADTSLEYISEDKKQEFRYMREIVGDIDSAIEKIDAIGDSLSGGDSE